MQIWERKRFGVRNRGIAFELRVAEREQPEGCYLRGVGGEDVLPERTLVCSPGILLRGRKRAEMECWIEIEIGGGDQGKGYKNEQRITKHMNGEHVRSCI